MLLTIVYFFCLSLISNLAVADKPERTEKAGWLEAEEFAKKKEKELLDAESALNKAKKLAELKEKELLDSVSALEEANKLAEQNEEELRKAEILLIQEDHDLPPRTDLAAKSKTPGFIYSKQALGVLCSETLPAQGEDLTHEYLSHHEWERGRLEFQVLFDRQGH